MYRQKNRKRLKRKEGKAIQQDNQGESEVVTNVPGREVIFVAKRVDAGVAGRWWLGHRRMVWSMLQQVKGVEGRMLLAR